MIELQLGGRSYTVKPLPIRASAAWRKELETPLAKVAEHLAGLSPELFKTDTELVTLLSSVNERIMPLVRYALIGVLEDLVRLLFAYSPELNADREFIETTATDSEAIDAFIKVLGVAYPLEKIRSLASGWSAGMTSKN